MGVQGLWELLAPVGRRVSVETLAGRKLAIDASIWIVQFMKAMRDDKGEMIRNAHLIGFFRRICKLLYLRVKPVFVFDGGTPALKRRTVIARRRQRERAQAKIRKTAEKLLLNHLRTRKLEELAQEIQNAKGDKETTRSKNEVSVDIEQKSEAACSSQTLNGNSSYEAGDALLAASLAAEEDGQLEKVVAESQEEIQSDESEEMDGSDEMILPVNEGKIDPAVLAVLPPSMQLDLLVQMREQQMAHNRQKFQKVKKAPASFSELQIQAYLKTVAFRREIDQVQKAASGRGIGGMPTSRIASQSDREFIFSSSFTGDKQALHFPGSDTSEAEERPAAQEEGPVQSSVPSSTLTSSLLSHNSVLQSEISSEDPDAPIQTYIDEKGHTRLSRHRAMGVRMTRDLQWNLYLMKESEEQAMKHSANNDRESAGNSTIQGEEIHVADEVVQITDVVKNVDMADIRNGNESLSSACTAGKEISIEDFDHLHCNSEVASAQGLQISFTEDDIGELVKEDELFAALVAGESDACNHLEDDMSECEWEEGKIEANAASEVPCHSESYNLNQVSEPAPVECSVIDGDDEIEWEDGNNVVACETNFLSKDDKINSRKFLSEEEELQEAIRRSLEDFGAQKSKTSSCQLVIREISRGMPLTVSDRGNELRGITDKLKGKDFTETERERKGKTLLTQEVDNYCVEGNSRLNGHTKQSFQIAAEIFETDMDITTNGEIANENFSKASGISTSEHEKKLQDAHLTVNNIQGLAEVEEFSRPMDSAILNEVHGNEQLCQTNHIEIQNDNGMNTLKSYEPAQAVEDQLAPNACASELMNDPNGITASVNDENLFYTSYQDKVIRGPSEGFLEDDLIKEAEETDISREREALFKKEAELDAMREENLRRKKDIEAELEAEKEALQASLDEEMVSLRQEDLDLQAAQKKHERNAESVTSEMFAECQELLQMFGLPYIIAPMEAEAQCAYLESIHLVDGVITDDCDVFLFGACNVYKNIFDERKYVETYLMKDIEQELGLNREKLIRMALLLGSDYTEGISGIGIVNAIEVVNSFPDEDGLKQFKEWVDSPDPSLLNKVHAFSGKSTRKKSSNTNKKTEHVDEDKEEVVTLDESTERGDEDDLSEDRSLALKKIFMAKHQAVSKNWHVPDTFPNGAVISAYTSPQVDKSTETFSWGRPDLMSLRKLSWERFGWNKEKSDEVLLPVLKEYDRRETQLRLEAFYSFNERFAKIRSRRIQKAVTGITGRRSSELMDLPPHLINTSQKKPRKKKENNSPEPNMVDVGNEIVRNDAQYSESVENGKEERKKGNPVPAEADGMVKASSRGRGRGQGKGRAGKRGAGRGRGRGQARKSTDDSGTEKETDSLETGQSKQKGVSTVGLRKSTRPHKPVKYALAEEDSGGQGQRDTDSDSDYDMSCETLPTKVPQKQPHTSPHSFTREGEHSDLEINWQQTGIENPDVGSRDDQQYSDHLASGGGFCVEEDNHGDDLHGDNDIADGNVNSQQIEIENPDVGLIDGEQYPGYLATGGGFCVEEDNHEDDLHTTNYSVNSTRDNAQEATADSLFRSSSSHLQSEHENVDYPSSVGGDLSTNHTRESDFKDVGNDNSCNERIPYKADGIAEREQRTGISASVAGLRAMPFLRKRKRT